MINGIIGILLIIILSPVIVVTGFIILGLIVCLLASVFGVIAIIVINIGTKIRDITFKIKLRNRKTKRSKML